MTFRITGIADYAMPPAYVTRISIDARAQRRVG